MDTKKCTRCLSIKDIREFPFNAKRGQYKTICKLCINLGNRGRYQADREVREAARRRSAKNRRPYSQWSAVDKANHFIHKAQYRGTHVCWIKDREKKTEALIEKLCEKNAKDAWNYWLKDKAPNEWMASYYDVIGKPWLNPRLTDAEKYRLQYRMDEEFQINERIRRQLNKKRKRDGIGDRMRSAINRGGKSRTVEESLGYSIKDLKTHLERQFVKGMNWELFMIGEIHIDHIVPQFYFDLKNEDDWKSCWALSNLQPLWSKDNLIKGRKLERLI